MTFFVNETGLSEGTYKGQVCAVGGACRDMPTLWAPCEPNASHPICGPASAWLCLAAGEFTYEIYHEETGNSLVREGSFILPQPGSTGCRMRVHLGSAVEIEPQTCIPLTDEDILSGTPDAVSQPDT